MTSLGNKRKIPLIAMTSREKSMAISLVMKSPNEEVIFLPEGIIFNRSEEWNIWHINIQFIARKKDVQTDGWILVKLSFSI